MVERRTNEERTMATAFRQTRLFPALCTAALAAAAGVLLLAPGIASA